MKTLLLLLLVALCGIAWRTPQIMEMLNMSAREPQTVQAPAPAHQAMGLKEYAELARTDPDAYRKLLESAQAPQERSEVDKLMNFLARGKYE